MCLCVCVSGIDFVFALQQKKVLFHFFMKYNLHFFVAMSVKSFTLSIPKVTSTLSSLITYFILKCYTKQQKKSAAGCQLVPVKVLGGRWLQCRRRAVFMHLNGSDAVRTPVQTPEKECFLMCSDA